ncbi:M48 family metallopeptidase [Variovorax sp. RTB1]|uniref:M48 metallopeptidase family protein n=1 Tax=Variovorax sp. RTB1 TaxID=3048631 RepID=UPI002B230EA3|nr:M48 family metallopeptidase [Variovorax sp. RTB1]
MVHETAHLREPQHTPEYWRCVERAMPHYEEQGMAGTTRHSGGGNIGPYDSHCLGSGWGHASTLGGQARAPPTIANRQVR